VQDPFIAIDAGTDLRAHARVLRRAWDSCLDGALESSGVRPVIAESWRRLAGAGLDPDVLRPRSALAPDELQRARELSPLADVMPALRACLQRFAEDAQHMMVVVDAHGRVLWLEGTDRVRHSASHIAFGEGMLWTEESAGTNAIGTALAIDHAVQIFSAEHFLPEQHSWWCSAAPIHEPLTGEVLGVVNLSGPVSSAHPHSLALVMAAAQMAETVLRGVRDGEDERLRQSFARRLGAGQGGRSALVAADGRVLAAQPAGWLSGQIKCPVAPGPVRAAGHELDSERLPDGDGWILRGSAARRPVASKATRLHITLVGSGPMTIQIDEEAPIVLGMRHAEVLLLLLRNSGGLSADALTCELYGDRGKVVTTRAEMSRLRKLLGGTLLARPYRLVGDVRADVVRVQELLVAGRFSEALRAYAKRLLLESEVPAVIDLRFELEGALQRVARTGTVEERWAWLGSEAGSDDPFAMAAFVRETPGEDPRRGVVAARLRALQRRTQSARHLSAAPAPA
jgi:hypothetical protein